jgi:hypothetical protein
MGLRLPLGNVIAGHWSLGTRSRQLARMLVTLGLAPHVVLVTQPGDRIDPIGDVLVMGRHPDRSATSRRRRPRRRRLGALLVIRILAVNLGAQGLLFAGQ